VESVWNLPGFRVEEQAGKAPVCIIAQLNLGALNGGAAHDGLTYPIPSQFLVLKSYWLLKYYFLTLAISQLESFNFALPDWKTIPVN
jgi:hypothetical protein